MCSAEGLGAGAGVVRMVADIGHVAERRRGAPPPGARWRRGGGACRRRRGDDRQRARDGRREARVRLAARRDEAAVRQPVPLFFLSAGEAGAARPRLGAGRELRHSRRPLPRRRAEGASRCQGQHASDAARRRTPAHRHRGGAPRSRCATRRWPEAPGRRPDHRDQRRHGATTCSITSTTRRSS